MVNLRLVSCLVVGVLAGCDGEASPIDSGGLDPVPFDPPVTVNCNPSLPAGQQGCPNGEKCAWVVVQQTPQRIGKLACVASGTVAAGGTCAFGPPGEATGFDNCEAGLVCAGQVCRDVCSLDGAAAGACAENFSCARYSSLFSNGSDAPLFGACSRGCDPLTQLLIGSTTETCGTGNGCYVLTTSSTTIAVCAGAGMGTHGQAITGQAFANSCAPGHTPRATGPGATTSECSALCRPNDVYQGHNEADEGGQAPFTCESRGASPPDSATAGESCRYWFGNENFAQLTPFSNTLGFCWKHAIYQYDTNGDSQPDAPFPRCITLTTGDVVPPLANPPHNDAVYFWCAAQATSFTGLAPRRSLADPPPAALADRLE